LAHDSWHSLGRFPRLRCEDQAVRIAFIDYNTVGETDGLATALNPPRPGPRRRLSVMHFGRWATNMHHALTLLSARDLETSVERQREILWPTFGNPMTLHS
jgi:hypothetical protein